MDIELRMRCLEIVLKNGFPLGAKGYEKVEELYSFILGHKIEAKNQEELLTIARHSL